MIEFKNVYKTYPNGFTALKDINLKIEQGEFVAIIGLSGAGKSTILRCINRMHDVTKGQLTVDGVDVNTLRGKALRKYRRKVGMIFQSFNLVSRSTAIKNVLTADVPDMPFFKVLFGIFSFSFLFSGFSFFGSSFFTALNDGLTSAMISFLRTLVFQLAAVLLFPLIWELDGIWLSIVGAEIMSITATVLFLIVKRKRYGY